VRLKVHSSTPTGTYGKALAPSILGIFRKRFYWWIQHIFWWLSEWPQ